MLPQELIRGSLRPIILKLLQENGRMYGYELTCRVRELFGGGIQLAEGALYPALHKMVDENILETESEIIENRERRYYSLTEDGKSSAADHVAEFRGFIETVDHLLQPKTPMFDEIN
jgi:PadR family transcriptional regulator, regulatory protein PadR